MGHHYTDSCEEIMLLLHDFARHEVSIDSLVNSLEDMRSTRGKVVQLVEIALKLREFHESTGTGCY